MKLLGSRGIQILKCETVQKFCHTSALNKILLEMPRENKHAAALRNHRTKMKEKNSRYSPGTVNLQVLGSGAQGAPRSLYLFTDQSRYLFNCGEGSQRLAHEHKMKLSKLEHIFVTQGSWENIGGLPGVALTIQDVGVPEITLHGPKGIEEIFTATRRFVILRNLSIKTADCTKETSFEDNAIKVKYIPLSVEGKERAPAVSLTRSPRSDLDSSEDDIDYYAHQRDGPRDRGKKRRSLSVEPRSLRDQDVRLWLEVMCFAVSVQPRPGTLCLEKCVAAGVKPGPLLGKLKAGEDIVLENGKIVRSADVTLPGGPSPTFLVVECPNESFLPALDREPAFRQYQMTATNDEDLAYLVVHFTPAHIMNHPTYRNWMDRFSVSTHHLVLNEDNTCMGSTAVHRIQYKLNSLEPFIFPLLKDPGFSNCENKHFSNGNNLKVNNGNENPTLAKSDLVNHYSIINGKTFYRIHLRPQTCLDNSALLKIEPEEYKNEVMNIDGFSTQLEKLKTSLSKYDPKKDSEYPNLVFLGTGSCIPNKARNTSAILINLSENKSMLLDCGEGTYGQLVRHFGPSNISEVIGKLRAIYVSHLHADHHIGLVSLLKARMKLANGNSLILLAPKQILPWLTLYDRHFESVLHNLELIPNSDMLYDGYKLSERCEGRLQEALDMSRIETTYVRHCPNAFGITLTHRQGWKITYSGDTMPSESLVEIGANSDLLVHEATMEDELINEAKCKLHSTTSQAIEIGRKMSAKYIVLTHFSQRYAKLPRIVCSPGNEEATLGNNVGIAFDNMKIRFSDLPKLHLLYPALKIMFQEDCEELEQKALKRQLRQERNARKKIKLMAENSS
ncbi:ribonuclease Z [Rhodnius prolixus]